MPLDRYAKRLLDMVATAGSRETGEPTAAELRDAAFRLARVVDARDVEIAAIENRTIPRAAGGDALCVRAYTPASGVGAVTGGVVYFHGGMGVFGSIDTHDGLCRMLANGSGYRVISVDYRLAPEHSFPAGLDDARLTTSWVAANADALGIDAERLVVAGDSAGGTLAAVVCQLARDAGAPRIARQLLFCPVTDLSRESASRLELASGYFIERSNLEWATRQVCASGVARDDSRISPLRSTDFSKLPPAHIHTAEFDPMRDEGRAYADALAAAGVPVQYTCHAGMIHHFYAMAGAIPAARAVVTDAARALAQALVPSAESAV